MRRLQLSRSIESMRQLPRPDTEPNGQRALVVVHNGETVRVIEPGHGVVAIDLEHLSSEQIGDTQLAPTPLQVESTDGHWRVIDSSAEGMFINGTRQTAVAVTGKTVVRLGHPTAGKALTFEVVTLSRPEKPQDANGSATPPAHSDTGEQYPGVVRAGAAVAARRRELGISQRSLAGDGVINAGALIAFEKGRSWPHERTRTKLEQVLRWPPGTIARIRRGQQTSGGKADTDVSPSDDPTSLITQAVTAAVNGCGLAVASLPPAHDSGFNERAAPILIDLRKLESIILQTSRANRITPELIKALGTVRRSYDDLMTLGARAPGATLAQRLYAARRQANLSILETAQAAGLPEEMISRAEANETLAANTTEAIETFLAQIW